MNKTNWNKYFVCVYNEWRNIVCYINWNECRIVYGNDSMFGKKMTGTIIKIIINK